MKISGYKNYKDGLVKFNDIYIGTINEDYYEHFEVPNILRGNSLNMPVLLEEKGFLAIENNAKKVQYYKDLYGTSTIKCSSDGQLIFDSLNDYLDDQNLFYIGYIDNIMSIKELIDNYHREFGDFDDYDNDFFEKLKKLEQAIQLMHYRNFRLNMNPKITQKILNSVLYYYQVFLDRDLQVYDDIKTIENIKNERKRYEEIYAMILNTKNKAKKLHMNKK